MGSPRARQPHSGPADEDGAPPGGAFASLGLIASATFLSMSVWFSASFLVPQLESYWNLSPGQSSLLTIAVQVGFVVGALGAAITGLSDALPGRHLMTIGALGASVANLALLLADGLAIGLLARLLTGACLALVYPPALKEVSTWFRRGRGTAFGVMIGALTLGSAFPHLVSVAVDVDWRLVIAVTSGSTAAGGLLMTLTRDSGPFASSGSVFHLRDALRSVRHRPVMLANLGYAGHMWELYAMWAWVGVFIAHLPSMNSRPDTTMLASLLSFGCIGIGSVGCLVGGRISDRFGRAQSALICLACSGSAAVVIAIVHDGPLALVLGLCAFWGFWVVADSAQFSALVTEHADPSYVGSAVSSQLALGYLTTTSTLWLVPLVADRFSWSWAIALLAIGPLAGILAMIGLLRNESATEAHA